MIETVPETGSTNADLVARLQAGEPLPEGYWLVADRQSAGRGRQGREWTDAMGNLMASTVVRLTGHEQNSACLSFLAGLAVYETVLPRLSLPGDLQLKWPNDLLLSGAKLAGILLEREGNAVVVGIGVNLANSPRIAGRATVSLGQFGPPPDRDDFAQDLASAFAAELRCWRTHGLESVLARWRAAAHPEGTPLTVHTQTGEPISGTFDGLAPDGALQLLLANGLRRVIHAGDVVLGKG